MPVSAARMVTSRIMIVCQAVAQFADKTSACSRTVSVALSCLSGVSPYLQRIRLTKGARAIR